MALSFSCFSHYPPFPPHPSLSSLDPPILVPHSLHHTIINYSKSLPKEFLLFPLVPYFLSSVCGSMDCSLLVKDLEANIDILVNVYYICLFGFWVTSLSRIFLATSIYLLFLYFLITIDTFV